MQTLSELLTGVNHKLDAGAPEVIIPAAEAQVLVDQSKAFFRPASEIAADYVPSAAKVNTFEFLPNGDLVARRK